MSDTSSGSDTNPVDELAATRLVEQSDFSKVDRDIAFAVDLLRASLVSERQLASALSNWTLHGNVSLADHLVQLKLLSDQKRRDLEERAMQRLIRLGKLPNEDDQNGAGESTQAKSALELMDKSGRVARLLGISGAVSVVKSDESREHKSQYQLIRKLGQGGLGTVWLARDLNLQRYVALKEIRNVKSASKDALSRFQREAEITGRLEHPGIVPIYQLGEDVARGQSFYVMRFLGKETLQDAIGEYHERRQEGDDDPMLLRNLLTSFVSVCQAVGHAHSRKVIHRDLKPENVAIDSFGQVIVIDWGLAKVLDDGMHGDAFGDIGLSDVIDGQRTLAGQVLGSPLYMAPEQAAGRLDEVDESTDIFGLGAILYAILTGEAPHSKSQSSSGSTTTRQLITIIASGPTPRARRVNEDVDPALDAICAKAMARKRYARYGSTTELAEDIQRWMAGEPVSAYEERLSQRIGRWIQHHQQLSQLIAAAAIIVIVAATTLTLAARHSQTAAQQARFEEMRSDEREVEVQLLAAERKLSGDVRFMSTLPPIQGIIDARGGAVETDSEEVWRGRLETIYEGLLRANSEYLAVAYIDASSDPCHEIVRVERPPYDPGYIRRVPISRLASAEKSPLLAAVMELEPGDVKTSLKGRLSSNHSGSSRRRIIAAVPVYDEQSGQPFGLVAIESDLISGIQSILNGLGDRFGEIYITDAEGHILVTSDAEYGAEVFVHDFDIGDVVPPAAEFFSTDSRQQHLSDNWSYIVRRVQLDPTDSECSLGIVHLLSDDESK